MIVLFWFCVLACLVAGALRAARFQQRQFSWNNSRALPWFVGAAVFLILAVSFVTVDAGSIGVVKRFGEPTRELYPGAHLIVPFVDTVDLVSVQTRIVQPTENASSHDLQVVKTQVTLAYHIDAQYATYVLVTLNNDAEARVINPAILEAIKAVTAQYDAQELITKRSTVRDGIEDFVKQRLAPSHIVAETTSITDLDFSPDFNNAIEAKVTAEQQAEKASNDLKRIQVEAQQKVAAAQGEADALRAQKEQITPELLQLRTIEMLRDKWDGHMPQFIAGTNGALPMLDILRATGK